MKFQVNVTKVGETEGFTAKSGREFFRRRSMGLVSILDEEFYTGIQEMSEKESDFIQFSAAPSVSSPVKCLLRVTEVKQDQAGLLSMFGNIQKVLK